MVGEDRQRGIKLFDFRQDREPEKREKLLRFYHKSGEILFFDVFVSIDKDGKVFGSLYNITKSKKAEEHKSKLAAIVESSNDAITSADLNGKITSWNKGAERIFGYKAEEMVGKSLGLLVPPDRKKEVSLVLNKIKAGNSISNFETIRLSKKGKQIIVSLNVAPLKDEKGVILGTSVIIRDITGHKKAELELRKAFTVVENSMNGIITADFEGNVIFTNPAATRMWGFNNTSEMIKTNAHILDYHSKDSHPRIFDILKHIRNEGQYFDPDGLKCKRKDGTEFIAQISASLIKDSSGQPVGITGSFIDITERKKAEEKLKTTNKELETFIYKSSHDLKGPLSSTAAVVNMANIKIKDKEALQYFGLISQALSKLEKILDDLTQIAVIRQGTIKLIAVDFNIQINEIIESFKCVPEFNGLDINIENQLKTSFYSDSALLDTILRNLIENSIKYQKRNTEDSQVNISINQFNDWIKIQISDNGIGIPEGCREKIFDMFFRANESSKGTGLGLYMVKNAVEKLGGNIEVKSKEKEGATFTVNLPNLKNTMTNGTEKVQTALQNGNDY